MWRSSASSDKVKKRCCNVFGCFANSKWQPHTDYFPLPADGPRRELWLKAINRVDAQNKNLTLYICDKHFKVSDLVKTPLGKKLSANAVPMEYLPSRTMPSKSPFDNAVQVGARMRDVYAETTRNFRSDMVVQAGNSFITEERHYQNLTSELERYQRHINMIESGEVQYVIELMHKACDKFLTPQISALVKEQTKVWINDDFGGKTAKQCLEFCFNLYHSSPRAYRHLREYLQLPSVTALKSTIIPIISTNIEDKITIAPLEVKVKYMSSREKYCSVMVDVMPLKSFLSYNSKKDKIVGFQEINGVQLPKPAQRAVVAAARGILADWTIPVGYLLISDEQSSSAISEWIDVMILQVLRCGLFVKTLVCASNKYLDDYKNSQSITIETPYFYLNNLKIYYMFETPHLLCQLRNTFLSNVIAFKIKGSRRPGLANFEDIKEFYKLDKSKTLKLAPKLTRAHVAPTKGEKKKKVYALQLFSRSVAVGLKSYIDKGDIKISSLQYQTFDFVLLINDLFDLLHASNQTLMPFSCDEGYVAVLENKLAVLKSLKFINIRTRLELATKPKFVEDLQINIRVILELISMFQGTLLNWREFQTRNLSLESVKNLCDKIKPRGKIPGSPRFVQRFRKFYLSSILQPPQISTPSDKLGAELASLTSYKLVTSDQISEAFLQCEEPPAQVLIQMAKTFDENRPHHLCAFLLKTCVDHHNDCEILRHYVAMFQLTYGLVERTDSSQSLETISGEEFVNYVVLMENLCRESFIAIGTNYHIASLMYNTLKVQLSSLPLLPCACFPVDFLHKLFVRLRIYMIIEHNNRIYRINGYKGKTFTFPSL